MATAARSFADQRSDDITRGIIGSIALGVIVNAVNNQNRPVPAPTPAPPPVPVRKPQFRLNAPWGLTATTVPPSFIRAIA